MVIDLQSEDARHSKLADQVGELGYLNHLGKDERAFDGQLDRQPGDRGTEPSVGSRKDANVPGRIQVGESFEEFLAQAGTARRSKFDGINEDG